MIELVSVEPSPVEVISIKINEIETLSVVPSPIELIEVLS